MEMVDVDEAAADEDGVVKLDAEEVAARQRELAAERALLEQEHAEAVAMQQAQEQEQRRSKRLKVFDKRESQRKCDANPDLFMCPQCHYPNYYPSDERACNKLECGNQTCRTKFCIVCGKPASASCQCISAGWAR